MPLLSPESIYVVAWDSALDLRLAQRQRAVTKHTPELILNRRTVTAKPLISPGDHWTICQNRSKCVVCRLNLLHTPDLEPQNCHRQTIDLPRWPLNHLPKSQQIRRLSPESASHLWADLEPQNCHRHTVDLPRWPLNHLPKSQQMPFLSPESIYVVAWDSALDLRLAQRQRAVTKH